MRPPPIDEIVGLLQKYSPSVIEDLKAKFPSEHERLRPGIIAGDPSRETKFLIATAKHGLETAITISKRNAPKVKSQLRASSRLNLVGQICTAIGGSSILAIAVSKTNCTSLQYSAGGLTLLGSILPTVSRHLTCGLSKSASLAEVYDTFIKKEIEAEHILAEVTFFEFFCSTKDLSPEQLKRLWELVTSSNTLCEEVRFADSKI